MRNDQDWCIPQAGLGAAVPALPKGRAVGANSRGTFGLLNFCLLRAPTRPGKWLTKTGYTKPDKEDREVPIFHSAKLTIRF